MKTTVFYTGRFFSNFRGKTPGNYPEKCPDIILKVLTSKRNLININKKRMKPLSRFFKAIESRFSLIFPFPIRLY